jgi:hypothetical protein
MENAIIERYSKELEKQEDSRSKQASEYVPLDTDEIRKCSTRTGAILSPSKFSNTCSQHWLRTVLKTGRPAGAQKTLNNSVSRASITTSGAAQYLNKLKRERDQLLGEQFNKRCA